MMKVSSKRCPEDDSIAPNNGNANAKRRKNGCDSVSSQSWAHDNNTKKSPLNVISPHIFQNIDTILANYKIAKPYPHGVLENVFTGGFLENVLAELKQNLKAKFKESDLFRVYQSIDIGNLDPSSSDSNTETLCKDMPNVMKLRQILYSQTYREFVEKICNIEPGTLIDQVDCAVNCHDQGCHLLCHDDVIGTRKVSYIIYLTDPDPVWRKEDGGQLELYDSVAEEDDKDIHDDTSSSQRVPGTNPVKTILPTFNNMAYFVVEPGFSFHSVQEVIADRPRLSLQGWYHAKEAPSQAENVATLTSLKSTAKKQSFFPLLLEPTKVENKKNASIVDKDLSQDDIEYLSSFLNKTYLSEDSIDNIRQHFEEESSVQLRHFFNDEWAKRIQNCTLNEDKVQGLLVGTNGDSSKLTYNYSTGVDKNWIAVGPSHKQRYLEFIGNCPNVGKDDGCENSGSLLKYLQNAVFQSGPFGRLLKSFTNLGAPLGYRGEVRRFRPGLDYTIAHYALLTEQSVLDATMCFVAGKGRQSQGDEKDDENDVIWQSDDKGGFECYIAADDEGDDDAIQPADEYDEEDDTKLLSVSASNNTLSLVYRDPGTLRFIKYLSKSAPSSRWDISMEYEVDSDDEVVDPP